ncbi:unnamed protein product [Symbiodinium pilosum]|uniref:Uncharacterized protein n=1 Tax=Symbiodinium pilosum TaxID=2952 RepID=A0A812XX40_SYMPI|nr:unnamed protein product [Symbiodinium pilosum]
MNCEMLGFTLLGLLGIGVAGLDAVAEKNLATAKLDLELGEGKVWNTATPAEQQVLMDKEAALYAPKITCAFTPSSAVGFEATGKSQADCGAIFGKSFTGIATHKGWKCDWAVVDGSDGKTVIAWCPFKYTLEATGEVVSSTSMLKYEFDDAGLIIGYFQEFDTSRFANGKSLSFSAAAPSGIASSGAMMLIAGTVLGSAATTALSWARSKPEHLHEGYGPCD